MKLTLSTQLLLRTPAFPTTQTLPESFEELKAKIAESSPTFHALIQDLHPSELKNQPEKIQFSLWKYFNRASYRPTPFGSFAAISLVPITYQQNPPILQSHLITHRWMDWKLASNLTKTTLSPATQLLTNSSVYTVADQIRYLQQQNGKFELASIQATPAIQSILETCKTKTSAQALYPLLKQSHDQKTPAVKSLLHQLIRLQLLHTELQPNITGTDYFQRLNISSPPSPQDYIISQRHIQSGSFDGRLLKHLPAYIALLRTQLQPAIPAELSTFTSEFQQRYEGRQIPLTELLDPEIGLGYGNFEQSTSATQASTYQSHADQNDPTNAQPPYPNTPLQRFLLQKLISGGVIDLSKLPIQHAAQTNPNKHTHPAALPNTLSAVFHRYQDQIVLSELGGATATALLGRFTPCSTALESYAQSLVAIEQQANPDVIFFDIAYQGEPAVDNINRRKQLYHYELPLLCWSETAQPLTLDDILVCVQQGQVILLSKTLDKRLIPRIPSAYNYLRSSLPLYRFLSDIQSQGMQANFHFSLKDRFPGLTHYPRVCYQNLIVSPASYLIPREVLISPASLTAWLAQQNLTKPLKAGHADQQLYFDPTNTRDQWALWHNCKSQTTPCYLTEALLAPENLLTDSSGKPYHAQYIASLSHSEQIYAAVTLQSQHSPAHFLPGSQWLYAKLYCHPQSANFLLLGPLQKLIKDNRQYIKKWFFIRYHDPKPHIRVRLQLKAPASTTSLLHSLAQVLNAHLQTGMISEFSLCPYEPELQRYGPSRMKLVEEFFAQDSRIVLQLIAYELDGSTIHAIALQHLHLLCTLTLENLAAQRIFAKKMFDHFAREFQLDTGAFKQLNADFRALDKQPAKLEPNVLVKEQGKWVQAFQRVILACEDIDVAEKLLADLIHMHVNRLFSSEQRWQEMILYHHLAHHSKPGQLAANHR